MSYMGLRMQMEAFQEQAEEELRKVVADESQPPHVRNLANDILHQWNLKMAVDLLRQLGHKID